MYLIIPLRHLALSMYIIMIISMISGCSSGDSIVGKRSQTTRHDDAFSLPPLPPPARYGNVLISRLTASSSHPPVAFSHWVHRRYFTCRVCHFELNFAMKRNTTDISEEKIRRGEYCGACHNDTLAFGISDDTCNICHTGNIGATDARFSELNDFPQSAYGDKINWVKALRKNKITPKQSIYNDTFEALPFNKHIKLSPEWHGIKTVASFPHQKHTEWLDCADCHPDIFNIKKKGTRFRMDAIIRGEYCGVCHGTVAFPVEDCKRCHPDLR